MELIKRHKGLAIISALALLLLVIIFAIFSRMLFSTGKGEYGDRLNGIVSVKTSTLDSAKNKLKEHEEVTQANVRVQGRIIYTTVTYNEGTNTDRAKEIAASILEEFDDEIQADYDFGFLITENVSKEENADGEEESKVGFSYAGTKIPGSEGITWTRK